MQILGVKAFDEGIEGIAARSGRSIVREWANRVLKRHARRETDLVSEVPSRPQSKETIVKMMVLDGIPDDAQERIIKEWEAGTAKIFVPDKLKIKRFFQKAEETMDWIEALPDSDRRIRRIERMSWKDADEAAKAWHDALAKAKVDNSIRLSGVVAVHNFENGNFIAKLTTAKSLKAEGAMMGHCVGGYWASVAAGEKQIYSLRDASGYPHVTIEMRHTPEVKMEDNTSYRISGIPKNGLNKACITESNWVAVQVRGKQNHRPVDKYLKQLTDWFVEKKIPWNEYGEDYISFSSEQEIVYFHINGQNYTDLKKANILACEALEKEFKGKAEHIVFSRLYDKYGLKSLHDYSKDREIITDFFEKIVPHVSELFNKISRKKSFLDSVRDAGLSYITKLASRYNVQMESVENLIFNVVKQSAENEDSKFYKQTLFKFGGISEGIDVIVHELPLGPLAIVANELGGGKEAEVLDLIKPHLEHSLVTMQQYPDCLHLVRSNINGVTPDHIRQAYLYAGLITEYTEAHQTVAKGLALKMNNLKNSLRKARPSANLTAENINLLRNMITEGYEKRIMSAVTSKFGNGFVIGFAPEQKSVAPKLKADPVIKSVGMSSSFR